MNKKPLRRRTFLNENVIAEEPVDPTKNVLDVLAREVKRHDDLSAAAIEMIKALAKAEVRRVNEAMKAETRRVNGEFKLRDSFSHKLSAAESKRIDAIRLVDTAGAGIDRERAAQQATVLANQVSTSAETLRALVATTANTVAVQFQNLQTQLTDRIGKLEQSQYEQRGRSGVADPMMSALVEEMKATRIAVATGGGEKKRRRGYMEDNFRGSGGGSRAPRRLFIRQRARRAPGYLHASAGGFTTRNEIKDGHEPLPVVQSNASPRRA